MVKCLFCLLLLVMGGQSRVTSGVREKSSQLPPEQKAVTQPTSIEAKAAQLAPPKKTPSDQPRESEQQPPGPQQPTRPASQLQEEKAPVSPQPQETAAPTPATQPSEKPETALPQPQTKERAASETPEERVGIIIARFQENILREIDELVAVFSIWKVILAFLILVLAYLGNKIISPVVERIARRRTEYANWLRRTIPLVSFSLWFLAVLLVATIFAQSLLAFITLSVLAFGAVAVALQRVLRDIVAGVVILLERPFEIGDRIVIGNYSGEVKQIGLRAFQLESPEGAVVVIPNAEVTRQAVANTNPGRLESQVTTELFLPAELDINSARKIAFEAAALSPYLYIEKPIEVYVSEEYRDKPLTRITIKSYVFDAQYERELRSDTVERAKKGFQQWLERTRSQRGPDYRATTLRHS